MATKLRKAKISSVDLVRAGANQEAHILLHKSDMPPEGTESPTEDERNLFERFLAFLQKNATRAKEEPTDPVEKDASSFTESFNASVARQEASEKLWKYTDALMQSIRSIREDNDLDAAEKNRMMQQSLGEFDEAMLALFEVLSGDVKPHIDELVFAKSDPDRYDHIEEVEKFNPYHDSAGRFATSDSHTLFTIRTKDPRKQHWADAAIAREKERAASGASSAKKPTSKPSSDTDTDTNTSMKIAGVSRGEPMNREQADEGNANPNFSKGGGYYTNCQSCVVTFEARTRGYDVQTKPNTRGSKLEELSHYSHRAWIDPQTGKVPNPDRNPNVTTARQCRTWLEDTIEPGGRYTFGHAWRGRSRSGHIICADKDSGGNLRLFDPQSGRTMTGSDVDSYLGRVKFTMSVYGTKINVGPRLLRVDNLEFNPEFVNDIMEATQHG